MDEFLSSQYYVVLAELEAWLRTVIESGTAVPWLAVCVGVMALVSLLASRSLAIGLHVVFAALVCVWLVGAAPTPVLRLALPALAAVALLLLALGLLRLRRRITTLAASVRALGADNERLQSLLEREVRWRRAAEPLDDAGPATSGEAPTP